MDTHEFVAKVCARQVLRAADIRGLPALLAQQRLLLKESKAAAAKVPKLDESAEWARVRSAIMIALDPFPEAQAAVVRALNEL